MDGCSIFLLVALVVFSIAFAMKAKARHRARVQELRVNYTQAKSSNNPQEIIRGARAIIEEFRANNQSGLPATAEGIYNDILGLLKSQADLKPFALEMGRLSYGSRRQDKNLTVYDEQAILNDINANM